MKKTTRTVVCPNTTPNPVSRMYDMFTSAFSPYFFLFIFLLCSISPSLMANQPNGKNNAVKKRKASHYSSSIGNRVWLDLNKDGIQDSFEEGLNGFTVVLYNTTTHEVISTKTASHPKTGEAGYYHFDRLAKGKYMIVFEIPKGYEASPKDVDNNRNDGLDSDADPFSGATDIIRLKVGEKEQGWNIGLCLPTLANITAN